MADMQQTTLLPFARGVVAASLGAATAHLVAAVTEPAWSPVLAVGSAVIDATPTPVKEWAVATFGTADKPILIGSVLVVTLLLAGLAGLLHERARGAGIALLVGLTALAGLATVTRPDAGPSALLPSLVAAAVGVATLEGLRRYARPQGTPATPAQPSRRQVLATGGLGVLAGVLGGTGQALGGQRPAPVAVTLPAAAEPLPALAAGVERTYGGISPFVTPAGSFYRIDTALTTPRVDPTRWRLRIDGMVDRPLELSLAELLDLPLVEKDVTLACVSNEVGGSYVGSARWLGVPTRVLLERAGVDPAADQVLSASVDGMTISTPVQALTDSRDALIAVGMNGDPLPPAHGYPARLVTPGLYGFVGATKWITTMTLTTYAAQEAYWTQRGWAIDGTVRTQSRVDTPRAGSSVAAGQVVIGGVAWAQQRGITGVEVRLDDGPWTPVELGPDAGIDYWRQWYLAVDVQPGEHAVQVRATDGTGTRQTDARTNPFPAGADGQHQITFTAR